MNRINTFYIDGIEINEYPNGKFRTPFAGVSYKLTNGYGFWVVSTGGGEIKRKVKNISVLENGFEGAFRKAVTIRKRDELSYGMISLEEVTKAMKMLGVPDIETDKKKRATKALEAIQYSDTVKGGKFTPDTEYIAISKEMYFNDGGEVTILPPHYPKYGDSELSRFTNQLGGFAC